MRGHCTQFGGSRLRVHASLRGSGLLGLTAGQRQRHAWPGAQLVGTRGGGPAPGRALSRPPRPGAGTVGASSAEPAPGQDLPRRRGPLLRQEAGGPSRRLFPGLAQFPGRRLRVNLRWAVLRGDAASVCRPRPRGVSRVSRSGNKARRGGLKKSPISGAGKGTRLLASVLAFFVSVVSLCAGVGVTCSVGGTAPRSPALGFPAGP